MGADTIEDFSYLVKHEYFYKGQTIFYEGKELEKLYIMESGSVELLFQIED